MAQLLEVLRTEQKYALNPLEAARLSAVLAGVLHADRHGGPEGYMVRSLYFDTPDDTDFYDKVDGYEMRRKLRIRIYSPADVTAKLELKEKQGTLQRKRSLTLPKHAVKRLCVGDYSPLQQEGSPFALELYGRMQQFLYRPKCIVEYNRKAFFVAENDTRITLDSNLRASESNLDLFAPRPALYAAGELGAVTMEVKFNHFLLSYVKDLASLAGRTPLSQSKYCAARNMLLRKDI